MSNLVLWAWLYPLIETALMIFGFTHAKYRRPHPGEGSTTEAIFQITTIGNHETVNWITAQIRAYELPFPHQLWIVVEPFTAPGFRGADEVLVVPENFVCQATHKARAQEYSRHIRDARGLERHDVKIVMIDDDTLPTREFFIDAFNADFDVCEGITTPRLGYGRFFTHMDDLRTFSCVVICATFQGCGHPIWVHGEGLTMRGSAEAAVTWDFPIVASEDLVFGQNAVGLGLKWGFLWQYVQLTSPWSWRDFIKQRRRWLWGNIHAVQNGLIPPLGGFLVTSRYLLGAVVFAYSSIGIGLDLAGVIQLPTSLLWPLWASLVIWLVSFGVCCWLSTGLKEKNLAGRVLDVAVGMALAVVTSAATIIVAVIALFMGKPTKFETIQKSRPVTTRSHGSEPSS
ncbi:MAG: glycosyltransferase family 2 protein [Acidimicrobiales bacterium]